MDETIMNELNYLPEYESLKMIPNDQWLLFVTLKYRKDIPTNSQIIKDVMQWLESVSQTINYRPDQLVWFCRIEDVTDGKKYVPRHVHLCIHKSFLDSRFHRTNLKLWTMDNLKVFLESKWKENHGDCLVLKYDPTRTPSGAGYCLKDKSKFTDVFISKGLNNLLKNTTEILPIRDPFLVGLLDELRKSDTRHVTCFMDELLQPTMVNQ